MSLPETRRALQDGPGDPLDRANSDVVLIVDDVRAGFRLIRDCSWELVGVRPDMSCWGKSFANGHPISALLGNDRCREGASHIYVTGSFWFAAVPMAAGVETLKILRESEILAKVMG